MSLRIAVTIAAAVTIASGAAAAVFALVTGDIRIFPPTFVIVTVVAVCLGLPLYWAARAAGNDTRLMAALMGFIVGAAVPTVFLLAGPSADQASVGDTATVVDGSYTLAGWLQSLGFIGLFGSLGVGGALLFWFFVPRNVQSDAQHAPSPPLIRTAFLSAAAIGLIAVAYFMPYATADRSCHNPLRGGGKSIGEVAGFNLQIGVDQWRNVGEEMQNFGHSGNWSIRSDVRTDESFPWLQISLCKETGTDILVQGTADFDEVSFGVYQPEGGDMWRRDFRALYSRINARWPTKVTFTNGQGQQTSTPEWAEAETPKMKR